MLKVIFSIGGEALCTEKRFDDLRECMIQQKSAPEMRKLRNLEES